MESLQALLQVGDVCGEGRKGLGGSGTLAFDLEAPSWGGQIPELETRDSQGHPFFIRPGTVSWASVSSEP